MSDRPELPVTETPDPLSTGIGSGSVADIVDVVLTSTTDVRGAVLGARSALTALTGDFVDTFRNGGTVHYVGAGASGRLAFSDAAELVATYGVSPERVRAHIAGGPAALSGPVEDAEDDAGAAAAVVRDAVSPGDLVIGVSASGSTPFVVAALRGAHARGAVTALISSAGPADGLSGALDHEVTVATGPEVVTGSTRLKAATAHKVALNAVSTAAFVALGRTRDNTMTHAVTDNRKLRDRHRRSHAATDSAGSADPAFLGVDIGGSGFRVVLTAPGSKVVAAERFPGSVGHRGDLDGALAAVSRWVAGTGRRVGTVVVGLAGYAVISDPGRQRFAARARIAVGARTCVVASDAELGFLAARRLAPGVALSVGTGAVAVSWDGDRFGRHDGLGPLLGDRGSGFWIARSAIHRVLTPGHAGTLEDLFTRRFGDPEVFRRDLARSPYQAALVASFAEDVIGLAPSDATADDIVTAAAGELAATLRQVPDSVPRDLTLVGSAVGRASPLADRLAALLAPRWRVGWTSRSAAAAAADEAVAASTGASLLDHIPHTRITRGETR
jgi:N-acetylmuramic acid 6-phosphate etherase